MADDRTISSRTTLLCLDKDEKTLEKYRKFLALPQYSIRCAATVEQGALLVRQQRPDLIFLDVELAAQEVRDAYQRLEADSFLEQSIIVLVAETIPALQDWRSRSDLPGLHDYLLKPIRPDELQLKISMVLQKKYVHDGFVRSNQKLNKALRYIKRLKRDREQAEAERLSEKAMLEHSLQQIALVIEDRARISEKLEQVAGMQERNTRALVEILFSIIELGDRHFRGHSKKVAEIACFIAREFRLPEDAVHDIEIASRLYELGRLWLPGKIRQTIPYEYAPAEKALTRTLPLETAALFEGVSGLQPVSYIIRHFHENYDGSGIPDGLKRGEIPIGSRILAGADLFDYLVYRRKGSNLHEAFQLIEKEVNARLDPQVVYHLHRYAGAFPVKDSERARRVRLSELETGMELAAGIYTQSGAKLLPMDTVLEEGMIQQLIQYAEQEALERDIFIK